jgi:guanylate kinase
MQRWGLAVSGGILYTVSAPSGAGKTSLVKALLDSVDDLVLSVSHTTRARRAGEVDGRDYHFVDEATFEHMIVEGAFLEHARVFGNIYGTSRAAVEATLAAGQDVLLEIDWQGARQVRAHIPGSVSIFVLPPSREALLQRLRERGQDSDTIIQHRMEAAIDEISHYAEADYIVVNDDFDQGLADLQAIVRAGRVRRERQMVRCQGLIDSLLAPAG